MLVQAVPYNSLYLPKNYICSILLDKYNLILNIAYILFHPSSTSKYIVCYYNDNCNKRFILLELLNLHTSQFLQLIKAASLNFNIFLLYIVLLYFILFFKMELQIIEILKSTTHCSPTFIVKKLSNKFLCLEKQFLK